MDPSLLLCDMTQITVPANITPLLPQGYKSEEDGSERVEFQPMPVPEELVILRQRKLDPVKLDLVEPTRNLGSSIFTSPDAMVLANIDAIYNLSRHIGGLINLQTGSRYRFCLIGGAPGAWIQYMHYRRPECWGYGMTPKSNDWDPQLYDGTRFDPYYGQDGTGQIETNYLYFINTLQQQEQHGVDLMLGAHKSAPFMLLLMIALSVLSMGGDFACIIDDIVTIEEQQAMYLAALSFQEIVLVKTATQLLSGSSRWLVCRHKVTDRYLTPVFDYVAHKYGTSTTQPTLPIRAPQAFLEWLQHHNTVHHNVEQETRELILNAEPTDSRTYYDYHRFPILWNLL